MNGVLFRRSLTSVGASFGLVLVVVLAACADSDASSDDDSGDSGTVLPAVDASPGEDVSSQPDRSAPDAEAGVSVCSEDDFCHSLVPEGELLRGVWGDGQGVVWAVSTTGDVLRWDGTSWQVHQHLASALVSIWGSGARDIWIVSAAGLLHSEGPISQSLEFVPVSDLPGDTAIPIASVWGTGPNDVWAVGSADRPDTWPFTKIGRVLHFGGALADGGTGWTVDDELSSMEVGYRSVWGSATSGTWVDGSSRMDVGDPRARVFRRAPGASHWTEVVLPDDPVQGVRPYPRVLTAANLIGDTKALFRTSTESNEARWVASRTDDGASFDVAFEVVPVGPKARKVYAFWGTTANDGWAAGAAGYLNHWDGAAWTQAHLRLATGVVVRNLWAIWGTSSEDFWVVGDEIALHRTRKGKP